MSASQNDSCRICGVCLQDNNPEIEFIRDWEYGLDGEWAYHRCGSCGVRQLVPFPTLDDLKKAYDIDYHGYALSEANNGLYGLLHAFARKVQIRKLRPLITPGARILDIGCGNGELLASLVALETSERVGIDFNEHAVKLTRGKGISSVYQSVFVDFPGNPEAFDVIFMNNYLEHTLSPMEELKKAWELLKPGGRLIGEVPNFGSLDRVLFGRYWGGNHAPRHTFQFDRSSLAYLFESAGFASVDYRFPLNTAHIAISIQNYLQRKRFKLGHNFAIIGGRARYFPLLLLLCLPVNLLLVLTKSAGLIDFIACKPK